MMESVLKNLQDRNTNLKSSLTHEQLKYGNYHFTSFKKEIAQLLRQYSCHRSLFKASSIVGLNPNVVFKWYIQGQRGNPNFKSFYLRINQINGNFINETDVKTSSSDLKKYHIYQHGDSWVYVTYIDGNKISIISKSLESLKNRVNSKNLPLDGL